MMFETSKLILKIEKLCCVFEDNNDVASTNVTIIVTFVLATSPSSSFCFLLKIYILQLVVCEKHLR